jgi:hypothetical protein
MDAIISRIAKGMEQHHYKFKMVSIVHLSEVQDAVGKLVRQGTISEKLYSGWHFYQDSNQNFPEAKTMFIIAMPQPITRFYSLLGFNTPPLAADIVEWMREYICT